MKNLPAENIEQKAPDGFLGVMRFRLRLGCWLSLTCLPWVWSWVHKQAGCRGHGTGRVQPCPEAFWSRSVPLCVSSLTSYRWIYGSFCTLGLLLAASLACKRMLPCSESKILRESLTYPEAPIGRGTTYAFQRELDSAISDFTKVEILNSEFRTFPLPLCKMTLWSYSKGMINSCCLAFQ